MGGNMKNRSKGERSMNSKLFRTLIGAIAIAGLLGMAEPVWAFYGPVSDNFNDGDFTSNPAWTTNSGNWSVNSQILNQNNTDFGVIQLTGFSAPIGSDYAVKVDLYANPSVGTDRVGILFNIQPNGDADGLTFFPGFGAPAFPGGGGALRFVQVSGGAFSSQTGNIDMGFNPLTNAFNTMQVYVDKTGTNFTVTVTDNINTPYTQTFHNSLNIGGGSA